MDWLSLDFNLSFGGACPNHLFEHSFVQGSNLSYYGEAKRVCIQLAQHQHWCHLWEPTKNVNILKKPIISYGWWRLFCLTWKDGKTPIRKWVVGVDFVPLNGTTKKKEQTNCGLKCQQWAPLKVGTLKASKHPHDELLRHLSLGTQSSSLTTTRDDQKKSIH